MLFFNTFVNLIDSIIRRFKYIFLTIFGIILGLITLLFGLLNMPAVQEYAKNFVVKELKNKIGTELGIGRLHFQPFNTIELDSVYLYDQSNEKVLMVEKLSASIDLLALLNKKVVINSAWLSNFDIHLSKQTSEAPLNIQYIIDAFKPDSSKPKSKIEIKISSINLLDGDFFYTIKDKPRKENVFDPNNIHVSSLEAKIALKSIASDSLNIQVKKLQLKEQSGLEISDLTFRLLSQEKKISIKGFNLELPSSSLIFNKCEIDLTQTDDSLSAFEQATLNCIIADSYISPKDISPLVPALDHFNDAITLRASISGSINNIAISDLSLSYGEKMNLISNIEVRDIRDKSRMYILGSIDDFTIPVQDAERLINNLSKNKTKLPKELINLGTISFQGDVSGYLNQLTAFGNFETSLGIIKTDILFGFNPKEGISSYVQGKVYTNEFQLGKLLNNKSLDKASLNISVDLQKPERGSITGNAKGTISHFDYQGYTYSDITLDANYDGLRVDGNLNINDPNGTLSINGLFDLSDKQLPELNFRARIENVQLDVLNIRKDLQHSYLSLAINANFKGKNIDNMEGSLSIDSIDFIREDKVFYMNKLLINASGEGTDRKLKITSDLLNGEVLGAYSFTTIGKSVLKTLNLYIPALIAQQEKKKPDEKQNNLSFNFQIANTEKLSAILKLPVTVIETATIEGFYNNISDRFKVEVFTPNIKAAGMNIKAGHILVKNSQNDEGISMLKDTIHANISARILGKKNTINDIAINSKVSHNLVETYISLVNDGKQKAKGDFSISTLFTRNEKEPLKISFDILPSELLLNNATWRMDKSKIIIQDGIYSVDNFLVFNEDGSQEIKINGRYSDKNDNDILKTELKNINLEYIFQTLAIDVLRFGGSATGSLFLSTIEKKPYANTRLEITDFKFNGTELGKLNIFSDLDDETNKVMLEGLILSKENKKTELNGFIDPINSALSLNFEADSIDIGFLNTYAASVFDNVSGRGTGHVHLFGNFSDVTVEGKAFIQQGNIGIKFLNTNYTFTDTIYLKPDLIYFNEITLTDQYKNQAIASGKVAHDYFHDFMYHVDLSANNFLVYNATERQNPIFWGKVFGSGKGSIGGDENAVDIDISMRTEDKTVVRMNFMENVVNEYSFITYKDKQKADSIPVLKLKNGDNNIQTSSEMDINMNFYIDATPDAVVELIMDPVGGDILRGSGSGAMQFSWSNKSSPRLYGTYNISRGSYTFTFQKLLERRFAIQEGSSVHFRGDPFEATLDVNAIYKITASLSDLDESLAQSVGKTTIPVNCIMNLTGSLRHPNVSLDIKFPSVDAEVERQVKSLMNTEDVMNKQVTYLLLLSKFYTPRDAAVEKKTSDFAAVASATLSNQLSKIASQIDDRWQLGTNIRYSDSELTSTEVELILSSQLLNDRLLINGNFGYRDDPNINLNNAIIGDVDVEYLLNNSGTWRVKGYNHFNEKYYYTETASQTQGLGIMFKKDFDRLRDLFKKPLPRFAPKDTIQPILPDSAKKGSPLSHFIKLKK